MNARVAVVARVRGLQIACMAVAALALLAGCGDKKDKPATQTAAKVNKEEITVHQINAALQQQRGLKPDQTDQASRRILERLIDQELAVQKASELKLDRDPRVMQQIEAAKREIIARAYLQKIGDGASKPAEADVKKYYDDNPALFKDRRVYQLQELAIQAPPEQIETLRAKLQAAKNINDFVEYLRANDIKFVANQAVRAAEQLPLASLPALAKMKDGQALMNPTPTGVQVVVVAGSRAQPVDETRAQPAIEQFLLNERKRKIVADDLKALRSSARVEYVGTFAASAPGAGDEIKAPTAADVAASAASGLDNAAVMQGLGIKPGAASAAPITATPVSPEAPVKAASGIDKSVINKGLGLK